ncbi:MAG TPA: M1 family metallopeptidase [Methylibium sp.]|nr:M1 family metallopeptidase [Methylibium sp.]
MKRIATLCLAAAAGLLAPAWANGQARYDFDTTATLLSKQVRPERVRLRLELDPRAERFAGEATIRLRVATPQPSLTLHAGDLEAEAVQLESNGRRRELAVEREADRGVWVLTPTDGRPIAAGRPALTLRYRGRVQHTGEGLFGVDYRIGGQPARMLATQLEAISARHVLPLFDEPVFRVPFELTVRAPVGYEVLSNTPRLARRSVGDAIEHRFAATPAMPPYLFAVTVGRFEMLEGRSGRVPLRIVTPPGKREQARYALDATRRLLPWLEHYFGQPYALAKLDQLAVPGVRQGAMEDWGLISYREDLLLYDPQRSSPRTRQLVFGIMAHELAHQWFGNLVSPASWGEIWLNEAFADWMQHKAVERFHPEWQNALRVRRGLDRTMDRDAGSATRAIRSGPVAEASVFEIFDGITYDKGGAVLSMLEQWIGEEALRRGLRGYMAERRMQPATAGDLWHHIGRAAGRPVAAVAASWTDQPGLPLVGAAARCEDGRTVVTLTQQRFSLGDALPAATWKIPVRLARGAELHTVMLDGPQASLRLPGCDARPLRANAGGKGYYRVEYDAALRARLAAALPGLDPADRTALLSDSHALARAGRTSMAAHFELLAALPTVAAADRAPLYAQAATQLGELDSALDDSASQPVLRAAARALLAPELARLGWQPVAGESSASTALRGDLLALLARFGDAEVVRAARERFTAALDPAGGVAPSLRRGVLQAVAMHAAPAEFDALLAALEATGSEEERGVLSGALGSVRDPALVARLLDASLTDRLPAHVVEEILDMLGRQPALSAQQYEFVLAHWEALARRSGDTVFGGRNWLLPRAAWGSNDPALARRLEADQQRLAGGPGASTAARAAASIAARQRVRQREAEALGRALADWRPRAP